MPVPMSASVPSHDSPRSRSSLVAFAMAMVLLLGAVGAACSSDDDDARSDETTSTTAAAEEGADGSATTGDGGTTTTGADDPGSDGSTTSTSIELGDPGDPPELSAAEQPYADALVATFDEDDVASGFTKEHVTCLAHEWVKAIGVDRFEAADVSPEELAGDDDVLDEVDIDRPTAEAMADGMERCGVDYKAIMMQLLGGDDITDEQRRCVEEALTDEKVREALVLSFMDSDDDQAEDPFDEAGQCLFPTDR